MYTDPGDYRRDEGGPLPNLSIAIIVALIVAAAIFVAVEIGWLVILPIVAVVATALVLLNLNRNAHLRHHH